MLQQHTTHVNATTTDPLDLPSMSPAFRFGYEDATNRDPFCPQAYFASEHQIASYTLGFLTAQPGNPIALAYWLDFLATDADEQRAAADYAAFVRQQGAW